MTSDELAARGVRVKELIEAYWKLRSYAVHDDDCTRNKPPRFRNCSCGLTAAIKAGERAADLLDVAARGVRVKALEWHDAGFEKCASSVAGYHRVLERNGLWRAVIHTRADAYFVAECETEEAAKAAAQADYESRILAALEVSDE